MSVLTANRVLFNVLFLSFQSYKVNGNSLETLAQLSKLCTVNASSYIRDVFVDEIEEGLQSYKAYGNALEALSQLSELCIVNASSYLKEVFENIKQEESAKLDPKILDKRIEKNFVKKNTNVKVVVNPGFKIEGISKVSLTNFKSIFNFKKMELDVGGQIFLPELKGIGTYTMNGKAFKYFPIRGNGKILIEVKGINGKASVVAVFNGTQFVADKIDFKISQTAIKLHLENLIDGNVSSFFNSLLNYLAKPLVDKLILDNKQTMDRVILNFKNAINEKLAHYDANTLLNMFQNFKN